MDEGQGTASQASHTSVDMAGENEQESSKRPLEGSSDAKATLLAKLTRKERFHYVPRVPTDERR